MINGVDIGKIFLEPSSSAQGYMKYRTVPRLSAGPRQINKAIQRIVSGQMKAKESLQQAQANT